MMTTTYDPEADAMFIRFAAQDVRSVRTEEVSPGVMLDFAEDGRLIAIEVLDVGNRMAPTARAA